MADCKHPKGFVQHRDGKPPWCPDCKALRPTRKELVAEVDRLRDALIQQREWRIEGGMDDANRSVMAIDAALSAAGPKPEPEGDKAIAEDCATICRGSGGNGYVAEIRIRKKYGIEIKK